MFKTIATPVDLAHTDKLDKALTIAVDLAKHYGARLCLIGVTASAPSEVARDPEGFAKALEAFAAEESRKRGIEVESVSVTTPDPATDLDDVINDAVKQLNADLVVMGSHVPGFWEHIFSSNAGYLASHSKVSVFVVR